MSILFIPFFDPFYALELQLFDFHIFRFSLGEATEEVTRKRKLKR